jgi:hypothetical protein
VVRCESRGFGSRTYSEECERTYTDRNCVSVGSNLERTLNREAWRRDAIVRVASRRRDGQGRSWIRYDIEINSCVG